MALTTWCPAHGESCASVSIIPLWPWGSTSFGAVSGSGTYVRKPSLRCSMCLREWSMRSSEDVFRSEVEMGCVNGSDRWAAMVRSDGSTVWRVRRLSAANWGDRATWEEAGVRTPVACWRRVTAATEVLCGRAWNVQDSPCKAPALGRASVCHLSLCLVLVVVNDLWIFSNKRSCHVQGWWLWGTFLNEIA